MCEALLVMTAQAAAPPPAAQVKVAPPPSVELLEFLAEWSEDDAKVLDDVGTAPKTSPAAAAGKVARGKRPAAAATPSGAGQH